MEARRVWEGADAGSLEKSCGGRRERVEGPRQESVWLDEGMYREEYRILCVWSRERSVRRVNKWKKMHMIDQFFDVTEMFGRKCGVYLLSE